MRKTPFLKFNDMHVSNSLPEYPSFDRLSELLCFLLANSFTDYIIIGLLGAG